MKRFSVISLSIIILLLACVSVYAVRIDGVDDGVEWQDVKNDVELKTKNGNEVNYAVMKHCIVDEYEFCIYLYLSDNTSSSVDKAGFIVNISDDLTVTVTSDGMRFEGDENKYSVESEMRFVDDNKAASCEILVGCKRGRPDVINGTVSFIDGQGINSYYYPFTVSAPVETTTAAKTTIPKTTVPKTTKPEKTTKSKPTEKKTTTTKAVKTTAEKTTKKQTEKKQEKTYVYFYEKEVIVSQVFITDPTESTAAVTDISAGESHTEPLTQSVDLTTGYVAQRVVVTGGIILLVAGGAVAGMSIKKSKDKEAAQDDNTAEIDK